MWADVIKIVVSLAGGFMLGRLSKKLDARQDAKKVEAERAPSFEIERVDLTWFNLRNTGTAVATGVTVMQSEKSATIESRPQDVTIEPGAGMRFMIRGMSESRLPPHFVVICDQLDGELHVPTPPFPNRR